MLLRIALALDAPKETRRLQRLLATTPDLVAHTLLGPATRWERLTATPGDLLLISRGLIPNPSWEHLATLRDVPDAPEIVVVAHGEEAEDRAHLLAGGCYAVLDGTLDDDLLAETLAAIIARCREDAEAKLTLPQEIETPRLSDFVSRSPAMQTFMDVVHRVVASDTTLLLLGETGVGKERLAQAIHAEGPRAAGPFIVVNCGAIPESLLESELFGHVQGAFTGATRTRRGWFELAHNGTIFLDEIGEMPPHLQVKLLRALQTREIVSVGSETSLKVDVRVMAATNRDLESAAAEKRFRLDLFYRLSVVTLEIPPLRKRREDIPILAERYIPYFQSKFHTEVDSISQEALVALTEYPWPGNVRELVNVIERALLLCRREEIGLDDLPEGFRKGPERGGSIGAAAGEHVLAFRREWAARPLSEVRREVLDRLERAYLRALLTETSGSIKETAQRAGMNARNLFEKMRKHGIRKEEFRRRSNAEDAKAQSTKE